MSRRAPHGGMDILDAIEAWGSLPLKRIVEETGRHESSALRAIRGLLGKAKLSRFWDEDVGRWIYRLP